MSDAESGFGQNKIKIQMDDEKLIEMVRDNAALYDVHNCRYADTVYRDKIWREIGNELEQSPLICKKRWGNIRDNFKKTLKKMALNNEQGRPSMKKYKFSHQLEFLRLTLDEKEPVNVSPVEIKSELDIDNNTVEDFEDCSLADTKDSEAGDEEKCTETQFPECSRARKRKWEENECEIAELVKYMMQSAEKQNGMMEKHPVDAFLHGIAPTLKSLSPYYLSLAKTQIYSIVQEYEMAMLMGHTTEKNQT